MNYYGRYVTFLSKLSVRKDKDYNALPTILEETANTYDVEFLSRKMKPMMFGSNQMHFDKGVGVCALNKSPIGMYVARIHTSFDTKCREENINYLVRSIEKFVERI